MPLTDVDNTLLISGKKHFMKIKKNLSQLDQMLRVGLGAVCLYLGFFDNSYIESDVLSLLIGIFGIANIVFAAIGACPVYWLANINTSVNSQTSSAALKIRNKLLTIFILVAFTIVTVFGFISYEIAKDFSVAEEIKLWEKFNRQKASAIAKLEYTDNFTANETSEFILLTEQLKPAVAAPTIVSSQQFQLLLEKIEKEKKLSGLDVINGKAIIWAITTVPGTYNKLLVIHNAVNDGYSNYDLAKTFLVAAFVFQWFSVWGALIISSIVSRRLNKQNDLIVHQALHDGLTGLPNKRFLLDKLKKTINDYSPDKTVSYLLIFDLDRFKDINDMLGHRNGDRLLKKFAGRLKNFLHADDVFARLEGNEFAILTSDVDQKSVKQFVGKITDAMDKPFVLDNFDIQCDVSIGVSLFPEHGNEPLALIRQAEVAMYQSKERNQDYVIYSTDFDNRSINQLTVLSELKQAIANEELCLFYQPKIDINSGKTVSFEALIRWQHPDKGMQFPDTFIPQAEQTGLIKPLTIWTLQEALKQIQNWKSRGIVLPIAVNLSQRLLSQEHLAVLIGDMLREYNVEPYMLELEITESAVMSEAGGALEMMQQLSGLGIPLSIDDFGTGFTSLSQLKDLPVNTLKIDKSFVLNMSDSKHDATIVNSIIHLAHNMGQMVVAEGIEDFLVWDELKEMGCDIGQGFYMARPMPANEVEDWLKNSPWPMMDIPENIKISRIV